jgi:molybdopterin synthase catalytic subunit
VKNHELISMLEKYQAGAEVRFCGVVSDNETGNKFLNLRFCRFKLLLFDFIPDFFTYIFQILNI